jgi:hypothetical protein
MWLHHFVYASGDFVIGATRLTKDTVDKLDILSLVDIYSAHLMNPLFFPGYLSAVCWLLYSAP